MTATASPILGLIAAIAEQVSNASVDLDPNGRKKLNTLDGRTVVIETIAPNERIAVAIRDGRIRVYEYVQDPSATDDLSDYPLEDGPNVWVRGQIPDLLRMMMSPDAPLTGLSVAGDETVLLEFRQLIERWQPGWPKGLQPVINQPLFENLQTFAEFGIAAARSIASGATDAVSRRAATDFTTNTDLDRFLDGIDDLRLRVDRLAAKIDQQSRNSSG